jgi:rubrerythrin
MTVEQAIITAIQYESRVQKAYAGQVDRISDPAGRRIFQTLADEEQSHLDYLHHKLEQFKQTGTVAVDTLPTSIPTPKQIEAASRMMQNQVAAADPTNDLQMLTRALELETQTSKFYQDMVRELPPEGQRLFRRFVEIEQGHVAIVQAEIDALTRSGYWFDCLEIDLDAV